MRPSVDPDEVILEFIRIGAVVRVSAMHPPSLTEVVIQGPATAGPEALERLALDKLAWRLRSGARRSTAGHDPGPEAIRLGGRLAVTDRLLARVG